MKSDKMNYNRMVENALRGVVREAIETAAEKGLPGDHHFYITFRTAAPGVDIPLHLSQQYPDEMTIVLQHQYWNLLADENVFSVMLSFNKRRESLTIPYSAVTSFADPGVQFALQFNAGEESIGEEKPGREPATIAEKEPQDDADSGQQKPEQGAEVVTLDAFRKK